MFLKAKLLFFAHREHFVAKSINCINFAKVKLLCCSRATGPTHKMPKIQFTIRLQIGHSKQKNYLSCKELIRPAKITKANLSSFVM